MSQLAELLEVHHDALLARWLDCVRSSVAQGDESEPELRDHVPELLVELRTALRRGQLSHDNRMAQLHGRQRYRVGFAIEAVVREYGLLRDCVFDLIEQTASTFPFADLRMLTGFLSNAIAEGVREHGQQQTGSELVRLERENRQVEALAEQLRVSEAQWRRLTDTLPVLISFVGADERYMLVNMAYEEWFGLQRANIVGMRVRDVVGEAAYQVMRPHILRGLAGEHFSFDQLGVPYSRGGTRDVRVTFVPHRGPGDVVEGYVALIEDITTRRRLERERGKLARQRTEVLDTMGDAFFALDHEWRIVLVNKKYEQLSERSREQTLGSVLWEIFPAADHPESQYRQGYQRCMQDRVPVHFVDYDADLDQWTDVRAYPTADGGISAFFRDVSAERRAEAALRRQAEFEQQLIGIVSHDLRTPLNVILLAASRLTRNEEVSESVLKNSVRIQNASERAIAMVGDLLDFTQARLGGGISIQPRPVDLHALVSSVVEEIEAGDPQRAIAVTQTGGGHGEWDPERLSQVVQNLVTNALKYSAADSVVEVSTRGESDAVVLRVQNAGPPIARDKLPVLFEPFQRAGQLDKVSRSVGLGLYIVRQIVEAHRGSVEVASDATSGTAFTVRLPRG